MRKVRALFVLLLPILAVATVACESLAQEEVEVIFPEDLFASLLQHRYSLDEARIAVAEEFDPAVATDLAVYLCTPPAHEACRGSSVYEAWGAFIAGIDRGLTASQVAEGLQAHYDVYLTWGIAVYWCSPLPLDGCEGDPITEAWSAFNSYLAQNPNPADAIARISSAAAGPLVAELIAASECGEPTCYAAELELVVEEVIWEPEPLVEQQSRQRPDTEVQYGFKPDKPQKNLQDKICKGPAGRFIDRCKKGQ
jgi:hypothetical protein